MFSHLVVVANSVVTFQVSITTYARSENTELLKVFVHNLPCLQLASFAYSHIVLVADKDELCSDLWVSLTQTEYKSGKTKCDALIKRNVIFSSKTKCNKIKTHTAQKRSI